MKFVKLVRISRRFYFIIIIFFKYCHAMLCTFGSLVATVRIKYMLYSWRELVTNLWNYHLFPLSVKNTESFSVIKIKFLTRFFKITSNFVTHLHITILVRIYYINQIHSPFLMKICLEIMRLTSPIHNYITTIPRLFLKLKFHNAFFLKFQYYKTIIKSYIYILYRVFSIINLDCVPNYLAN